MRLAVVGSRTFEDYELLSANLQRINPSIVISGGAKGADSLAKEWAKVNNKQYIEHLPDWESHGNSAGYRRNQLIVQNADGLIAFWDGQSKGTKHSIDIAQAKGIPVWIVRFEV